MGMQYQIRNVDVQFLIDPKSFDAAVRCLHEALIETRGESLLEATATSKVRAA